MIDKKPLIVVTNDDGITSKGIRVLVEIAKEFGEVMVVAPSEPQSGQGHAITIHDPLKIYPNTLFEGLDAYEVAGTPADCVKLSKHFILKGERKPDLVLSGINHGSNTSVSVIYSGTMSAAIEAAIEGIPAIGFSVGDYDAEANMSHAEGYIKEIIQRSIDKGIPQNIALNVNIPKYDESKPIKGIKICQQAKGKWVEEFDARVDPYGREYLWLSGEYHLEDESPDTGEWAVRNGFVAVVPTQFDLTSHQHIATLKKWGFD